MLAFFIAAALSAPAATPQPQRFAIHWPNGLLHPVPGTRIDEVHLRLACGSFRAVDNVPIDWNLEIVRPISAVSELHMTEGHGASALPDLQPLDGVIVIENEEDDCFDVSAVVWTATREIHLDRHQLRLVPIARLKSAPVKPRTKKTE